VAALLLVASFFLPNAVAGVTDLRRLNNLIVIDSQSISFDSAPDLSLPERIELFASPNSELLALKTGNAMDSDAAESRAIRELARFFRDSPFEFDFQEYVVDTGTASLVIDTGMPVVNMVIWEFEMYDPYGTAATVTIDDETGLLIKLVYRRRGVWTSLDEMGNNIGFRTTDEELLAKALSLSELMESYYGMPVALGDYQYSGNLAFYRADLTGADSVIPMYGVVRASSFSMNERT